MGSLQQLQVTYSPQEDRILLRVNTTEREEFRFWLTRRLVMQLLPGLTRSLATSPEVQTQPTGEARRELARFRHEKALAEADFDTAYREEAEAFPLGETPLLVTALQLRRREPGVWVLVLLPAQGQGSEIALKEPMVHSLASLLRKAAGGARWAEVEVPEPPPAGAPADVTIN